MKITTLCQQKTDPIFVCDFSPLKSPTDEAVEQARNIDADYICVAYNPGKAVRTNSAMLATAIKQRTGRDAIFNLATRDMNKLALQSQILGAQLLDLDNVLVVQGDKFTEKDLKRLKEVNDFKPTELIQSIAQMNAGRDFKNLKLKAPTDLAVGASIDLSRDLAREARLTRRKAEAGADYFLVQPVFNIDEIAAFRETYRKEAGASLSQPVFFGLQILVEGGVLFSNVPDSIREQLAEGRDGVEIALEMYRQLETAGIRTIYLVPPILRGGARDYGAAQRFLAQLRP